MKILGALFLLVITFAAGAEFQRRQDNKRVLALTDYWHLTGPTVLGEQTTLNPSGVAVWKCTNDDRLYYAPIGHAEGLSACKQIGIAKVRLQLQ